jgi:hypothetical protein
VKAKQYFLCYEVEMRKKKKRKKREERKKETKKKKKGGYIYSCLKTLRNQVNLWGVAWILRLRMHSQRK